MPTVTIEEKGGREPRNPLIVSFCTDLHELETCVMCVTLMLLPMI